MSWHLRQSTPRLKCWGKLGLLLIWVIALFMLLPVVWAANQGDLDPTFGNGGIVMSSADPFSPVGVDAIALQGDNKIVIAGQSSSLGFFLLARYKSNGELDNTFGQGGIVTTTIPNFYLVGKGLAIQTDGKIVVVGGALGRREAFALARYNSNGELDNTFGRGGIVTTTIHGTSLFANEVALQTDGKIVVVGSSATNEDDDYLELVAVARYKNNGALDSTFGPGGIVTTTIPGPNAEGEAIVLQPDGKIVVVGVDWSNSSSSFLARWKTDGKLDNTFDQDGVITIPGFFGAANDVVIQVDGKILVGSSAFALARYRPQGDLDNDFGHGGIVTTTFDTPSGEGSGSAIAIQPDGRIIVAGTAYYQFDDPYYELDAIALARYDVNGKLDRSFNNTGIVTTTLSSGKWGVWATDVVIQPDRKIVVAGSFGIEGDGIVLARYLNALEFYLPLIRKNS
ncbi:MAG: hypothetical protein HS126_20460 [Anaerolineales bacterium]|nr:hypothetical protein [Anaerolineales bacterium]